MVMNEQDMTNSQALLMPMTQARMRTTRIQDSNSANVNLSHCAVRHGRKTPATLATSRLADLRKTTPGSATLSFFGDCFWGRPIEGPDKPPARCGDFSWELLGISPLHQGPCIGGAGFSVWGPFHYMPGDCSR